MKTQRASRQSAPGSTSERVSLPPTTTPTRTRTGGGWRIAALVLVAGLVGLVALARFGDTQPAATPRPSSAARAATQAPATLSPTQTSTSVPTPVVEPLNAPPGPVGVLVHRRADGLSYLDGIPSGISGESVYRVRDALLVPTGTTLLVGGWYYGPDCHVFRPGPCPPATLSDIASGSPRTDTLVLDASLGTGTGARVIRVTTEADPACYFTRGGACLPRLRVLQNEWSGDGRTATAPIGPMSLLGALSIGFPYVDFTAFQEPVACPLSLPSQSYLATPAGTRWAALYAPVRLVFMFASVDDLNVALPAIERASRLPLNSRRLAMCDTFRSALVGTTAWVTRDNALLLISRDNSGAASIVDAALSAAQSLGTGPGGPID